MVASRRGHAENWPPGRCDSVPLGACVVARARPKQKRQRDRQVSQDPSQILTASLLPRTRTVGDERGPHHHHTARPGPFGSTLAVRVPWRWAMAGVATVRVLASWSVAKPDDANTLEAQCPGRFTRQGLNTWA